MTNRRIVWIGSSALAGILACSSSAVEGTRALEQSLGVAQDGAAPDADAQPPAVAADAAANGDAAVCAHSVCATGVQLLSACDPCATLLCGRDPYCCSTTWDGTCVAEVSSICGANRCTADAGPADTGPSACIHPACNVGSALAAPCDPCVTKLCAQDPYCCSVTWDATCVGETVSLWGSKCN